MKEYADSFLELIYPEKNTCFICDKYDENIGDAYICDQCEQKMRKITAPVCAKCSKPITYDKPSAVCRECASEEKYFQASKSLFEYEGAAKKAIYDYKYYNKPYFYKMFGGMMVNYMKKENYLDFNYIIPVPLHPSKLRQRGYNQAELLAVFISQALNIPYIDGLKRIKKTKKQSQQSKAERQKNLRGAFGVKMPPLKIIDKSVLLVDDIYTTGSTVNECSKVLLDCGADKVFAITIAR